VDENNQPVYNYYGLNGQGIAYPDVGGVPAPPTDMPGINDTEYPALKNPNAPDDTIITHCTRHRSATGNQAMDIVLRLGGDAEKVPSGQVKWMAYWNW
jgi:hypothetical protein